NPEDERIGARTDAAMINRIIDAAHPDYIQIDGKGHRGLSSYPTRVGTPAPWITGNPLRIWRETTAKRGVSLYLHYSGVADEEAILRNPSWAAVTAKDIPDKTSTSVFGPYVDDLMIPQLKELAGSYGLDGVWVDGECWAVIPDYSANALRAFRESTGITNIPRMPEDPNYREFMQFNREGFRKYLRHYVDVMHATYPNFEVASNWAFSDQMPERVSANVDFLSGDFAQMNSINWARFSTRCLARQGKPWDLMAWTFAGEPGNPAWSLKSIPQLQREAAMVLSMGGGFQAYFRQQRDGSIFDWQIPLMKSLAEFCRDRQAVCHRAQAVPQIAVLYSQAGHYRTSPKLFSPRSEGATGVRGTLQGLLENQQSVEVLGEHHLSGHLNDYPLVVVPEWDYLEPAFRSELTNYVHGGGHLLLIGPKAANLFTNELGIRWTGAFTTNEIRFLHHQGWSAALKTGIRSVEVAPSVRVLGRMHPVDDPNTPGEVAGIVVPFGKGSMAATFFNFGERYQRGRSAALRDYLGAITRELFPTPLVQVTGSHLVDVSVNRQNGRLAINLVNTAGPHTDETVHTFDEIPAVGPLQVSVRSDSKPRKITQFPGGTSVRFQYRDGVARFEVPRLAIHEIFVVE
ncbi:MAG TPA: hypothetical protein VK968_11750, partial [Roseimicrobium sp.]|nr:hypothetical protein [Roseimicrobium sp.]